MVGNKVANNLLESVQGRADNNIRRGDRQLVDALSAGGSFRTDAQGVEPTTRAMGAA